MTKLVYISKPKFSVAINVMGKIWQFLWETVANLFCRGAYSCKMRCYPKGIFRSFYNNQCCRNAQLELIDFDALGLLMSHKHIDAGDCTDSAQA